MDFQFWLYVIIGVIYLISRLAKKPANPTDFPDYGPEKPVPGAGSRQPSTQKGEVERELTFEELLREITEGKVAKEPYKPAKEQRQKPVEEYERSLEEEFRRDVSYEEEVVREDRGLEDVKYDHRKDDKAVKAYDEAKRQAFLRPSLEETMDIGATDMKFGRFKEFEQAERQDLLQHYLGNLKDAESWKKAIVVSEILKRKF
jgi:hypothetical protein